MVSKDRIEGREVAASKPERKPESGKPAQAKKDTPAHKIVGRAMERAITAEQINAQRAQGELVRHGEVRQTNEEERTVEVAFSSEAPVMRWFGEEVLDHSPGAMVTERMSDGAAVLLDHDWRNQVGVVDEVTLGADRRGRARIRFSRSARGQEVFQDVIDGIRRHVSVGYRINRIEVTERQGQPDLVRVLEWEPYEISMVAVPADTTVGVGRAAEQVGAQEETRAAGAHDGAQTGDAASRGDRQNEDGTEGQAMFEKILRDAQGNLVRAKVDENDAIVEVLETIERAGEGERHARSRGSQEERERVAAIFRLAEQYGAEDLARQHATDGSTAEDFQRALLEHLNSRQGNRPLSESTDANVGLSDREVRNYSMFRAVRAMMPNASQSEREAAAFEFECSRAAETRYQREARGILVPQEVLERAFNAGGAPDDPTGAQSGQNTVATTLMAQSFIDMLRNRTTILRLAQPMMGLVGNVDVPKQTGGATAYWLGEGEDAAEGTPVIGQIGLSPHTVAAYTDITRRLMMQSTPDAEGIVRRDLAAALALAIDHAGYYGSGESNEPRGIVNYNGINAVDFDGAGGMPTYEEVVEMESAIAADNADVPSMAYVVNAMMRGHLKTTQKFDGTNGAPVWEASNTVNGYTAEVTNQIQNGDAVFGNFADLIAGMWGGLDLTVDPYSLSKSGGTRIVMFQDIDFVLRRTESFCLGRAPAE